MRWNGLSEIQIDGLKELQAALKKNATMQDAKNVVQKNGKQLLAETVKNAGETTFHKGYFTGNTKQNIAGQGLKIADGGLTATVGATTDYGPYLENGTRFMAAEPFLKGPAKAQAQQFKADMNKLTK